MNEILTHRLVGMSIVGTDGTTLGTLANITLDPESGVLRDLVVEPRKRSASSVAAGSDDGRLRIPVDRLESVSDRIVVRWDRS